jgi:hypothetical protein
MNQNNKHKVVSILDSEQLAMITACLSDTILKSLYQFGNERNLFGYIGTLSIIAEWAKEFYHSYYFKMKEWDTFEESVDNIYNVDTWDDFLVYWSNDKLNFNVLQLITNSAC